MLVPTRVGMIPLGGGESVIYRACPHTRGDDPHLTLYDVACIYLSPHAWG